VRLHWSLLTDFTVKCSSGGALFCLDRQYFADPRSMNILIEKKMNKWETQWTAMIKDKQLAMKELKGNGKYYNER